MFAIFVLFGLPVVVLGLLVLAALLMRYRLKARALEVRLAEARAAEAQAKQLPRTCPSGSMRATKRPSPSGAMPGRSWGRRAPAPPRSAAP